MDAGAPQPGLARLMVRIRWRTAGETLGRRRCGRLSIANTDESPSDARRGLWCSTPSPTPTIGSKNAWEENAKWGECNNRDESPAG